MANLVPPNFEDKIEYLRGELEASRCPICGPKEDIQKMLCCWGVASSSEKMAQSSFLYVSLLAHPFPPTREYLAQLFLQT
ncbi:hypothetical protein E1B28_001761 [Marasmius oreades]|uniref:Uncharacterized protein n=1 Tax=Marasmius oreades TaxID=181124 RepID=A0A9P7V452_9AGAR|nr:uncharacterized protein E1B28_001761 [Marasmius oreades]KAG7099968.1 hypothetical protein E1B28_001761 [Marasmius oreades]